MEEPGIVKSVSWRDLCPWFLLLRCFRIAVRVSNLALATVAVLLISCGWSFSEYCFLSDASLEDPDFQARILKVSVWHCLDTADRFGQHLDGEPQNLLQLAMSASLIPVASSIVHPFASLFNPELSWDQWFYFLFGGIFSIACWGLFGLAIVRIAIVRLGTGEVVMLREAFGYSASKWTSCFAAPLLPYLAIFALAIPMLGLGFLIRFSNLGILFAGMIWLIPIVCGFLMAILSLGLIFGWPMMWGTIAAEGSDGFDAISRSYSYAYQRPINFLFYVVVASVIGILGWFAVYAIIEMVTHFCVWMTSWGAGERWSKINEVRKGLENDSSVAAFGVAAMDIGFQSVRLLLPAFAYAYFWTTSAAVYLLLRHDIDQTELDDIYFVEDERNALSLPTLDQDEAGIPKAPGT